jgi:NAD(P)-dependent dehydrogenase (short-subunit alcohol dehydrogenase family)
VVLVTGASSGIGRATALHVAARGDHVVLVARGADALEAAASACREAGAATALALVADVGDDAAVEAVVARVLADLGTLDLVVHAAGVVAYGRTEEIPPEVFEGVLRTNLVGSVHVARHVVPVLRRQRRGGLVLVGSVIGHVAVPLMSPYVLSKWGVRALARQLTIENRDVPRVRIAYVAPGGVDTPIYAHAATSLGMRGRPPPPVARPERVARSAIRRGEHGQLREQVGLSNDLMRLGFHALPRVYDVLVGPLFGVAALDRTRLVPDGPGNVLDPSASRHALHGDHGHPVIGLLRNLHTLLPRSGPRPGREGTASQRSPRRTVRPFGYEGS